MQSARHGLGIRMIWVAAYFGVSAFLGWHTNAMEKPDSPSHQEFWASCVVGTIAALSAPLILAFKLVVRIFQ